MVDVERLAMYQAMAKKLKSAAGQGSVGSVAAVENQYLAMASNWSKGNETMLPDVNSRMQALAKKWKLDDGNPQKQLAGPLSAPAISTGKALWQVGAAKLMTIDYVENPFTGKRHGFTSAREKGEGELIARMNAGFAKRGIDARRERPTPEILHKQVKKIEEKFSHLLSERIRGLPTPQALQKQVYDAAKNQTRALLVADVGVHERPNEAEERLAAQLTLMVGHATPAEIREKLIDHVFARAADIELANQQGTLARLAPEFNERYTLLKSLKPEVFFVAPWLTTEVMFPKETQGIVEDTVWALSPTKMEVRRVIEDSAGDDTRIIEMKSVNDRSSASATITSTGTPPYADALRKSMTKLEIVGFDLGRILQPYVDALIGVDLGGIIVLRSIQAVSDPIILAVQNAPATEVALSRVAQLNRDAEAVSQIVNSTIAETDAELKQLVRPAMVKKLLPPLATERTIYAGSHSQLLYEKTRQNLLGEYRSVTQQYEEVAENLKEIGPAIVNPEHIADKEKNKTIFALQRSLIILEKQENKILDQLSSLKNL